jgi:4-amino-4-deoxy-L-arabinose transferase-like glycosyltransferase
MGALAHLRTTCQSLLAGVALLALPVFYYTAAREEADLAVAFFILTTLALLFLYHNERRPVLIVLAGLSAGFAGWTKNEGLLFLLTGSFAWLLMLYRQREIKQLKWYALGLALPLAVILYLKLFLTPPNDLFDQSNQAGLLDRLTNFERFSVIGRYYYGQLFGFGSGKLTIFLIAVYGLIVGLNKAGNRGKPALAATIAILLQLAGYFMIYVLTPHDLDWHLRTSMYRLMIHVFPAMLFTFFVSITDPETIFTTESNPSISNKF